MSHIFLTGSYPLVGASLLIQDSEIAESLGVSSPKQTDPPVRVNDRLQPSQDNRRRASTGSSTVSDAGSTNEVDSDSRIQYDHSLNKSYGMHSNSCIFTFFWLGIIASPSHLALITLSHPRGKLKPNFPKCNCLIYC